MSERTSPAVVVLVVVWGMVMEWRLTQRGDNGNDVREPSAEIDAVGIPVEVFWSAFE